MLYPLADGAATTGGLWAYLVVFVLVAIGWAGIPAIGGAVIAGAAVLASEGHLNFAGVLVASLLVARGRQVVSVDDDFANAAAAGLPLQAA